MIYANFPNEQNDFEAQSITIDSENQVSPN